VNVSGLSRVCLCDPDNETPGGGCRTRTGVVRSEVLMGSGIVRMVVLAVDSVDEICTVR